MKYTSSSLERETERTTPLADDVYQILIASAWSGLTEEGALTFTAQFWHETGAGKNCYNWNLGNVKASAATKHMYLRNVWEVYPTREQALSASAGGMIASEAFLKSKGLSLTSHVVVFQPPRAQCRFAAYDSLAEGAARWIAHHQKHPAYLPAANAGDLPTFNRLLKASGYYTADEAGYLKALQAARRAITK